MEKRNTPEMHINIAISTETILIAFDIMFTINDYRLNVNLFCVYQGLTAVTLTSFEIVVEAPRLSVTFKETTYPPASGKVKFGFANAEVPAAANDQA